MEHRPEFRGPLARCGKVNTGFNIHNLRSLGKVISLGMPHILLWAIHLRRQSAARSAALPLNVFALSNDWSAIALTRKNKL
ncbi:MAG: hypothetical protein RLZZ435_1358 [Cyanobacteriota bacterium]|jgi:hypothetical protein